MGALDLIAKAAKGVKNAPFFSKADVVLDELQRGKGTGDEFLTELVKKGVKPTELKDRGLDKALKGKPKMTKAEVQKVFEQKAPPKVQEKVLREESPDYEEFLEAKAQEEYGVDWFDLSKQEKASIEKMFNELPTTQYEQYKTPGGENYREILLKLPSRGLTNHERWELDLYNRDLKSVGQFPPDSQRQARYEELKAKEGDPNYISGHYKNDPNLLAHIRVQDFQAPSRGFAVVNTRSGNKSEVFPSMEQAQAYLAQMPENMQGMLRIDEAAGKPKKVLLVDEIQSDWHQEGRKRGYGDSLKEGWKLAEQEPGFFFLQKEGMSMPMASGTKEQMMERANYYGAVSKGIPDAPFKKNWHELAMKRVLDYAAENGYDSVAITPGAEQAKRYSLAKQVSRLEWKAKPGSDEGSLLGWDKNGENVVDKPIKASELEDYVGKDVANNLLNSPINHLKASGAEVRRIEGTDLEIGGEGMKGFYDKILPDYLNNYGKQYGAQTGQISLRTPSGEPWNVEDAARFHGMSGADYLDNPNRSQLEKQFLESRDNQTTGFHSFDITPQMREQIQTKGQPMYGKVAMPALEGLAAGSGAATMGLQMFDENNEQSVQNPVHFTENPDAMLLELMQRN